MTAIKTSTLKFSEPVTAPVLVPVEHKATPTCINDKFMVNGTPYGVTAMSFGSPHGAVIVEDTAHVDVETIGSALGNHVLFPKGASIVFIEALGKDRIKARLWQRGEGEKPFSAEAVCVAGVAAMMLQKILQRKVSVHMGGCVFEVRWNRGSGVSLTGPAKLLEAQEADSNANR